MRAIPFAVCKGSGCVIGYVLSSFRSNGQVKGATRRFRCRSSCSGTSDPQ